jgi:hypothetical protein
VLREVFPELDQGLLRAWVDVLEELGTEVDGVLAMES